MLGLAALVPLVKAAGVGSTALTRNEFGVTFEFGYVFAAIAAGVLAYDKYFGLSTGWIRYIQTQLVLEGALDELGYDWVSFLAKLDAQNPSTDQIQTIIQRLRSFIVMGSSVYISGFCDGPKRVRTSAK